MDLNAADEDHAEEFDLPRIVFVNGEPPGDEDIEDLRAGAPLHVYGHPAGDPSLAFLVDVAPLVESLSLVSAGITDYSLLPHFNRLRGLALPDGRPGGLDLTALPDLRTFGAQANPAVVSAMASADLTLDRLLLRNVDQAALDTELARSVDVLSVYSLKGDCHFSFASEWQRSLRQVEIIGGKSVSFGELPRRHRLNSLHLQVRKVSGMASLAAAEPPLDSLVLVNCREVDDVGALIASPARSINIDGAHVPLSRDDAARISADDRERWYLPPRLRP